MSVFCSVDPAAMRPKGAAVMASSSPPVLSVWGDLMVDGNQIPYSYFNEPC